MDATTHTDLYSGLRVWECLCFTISMIFVINSGRLPRTHMRVAFQFITAVHAVMTVFLDAIILNLTDLCRSQRAGLQFRQQNASPIPARVQHIPIHAHTRNTHTQNACPVIHARNDTDRPKTRGRVTAVRCARIPTLHIGGGGGAMRVVAHSGRTLHLNTIRARTHPNLYYVIQSVAHFGAALWCGGPSGQATRNRARET